MRKLEALIFDVDGTLADTERDGHRTAFNRAFAEAGLDWDWSVKLYGELLSVTGGKERILYYIDRYRPAFPVPTTFQHSWRTSTRPKPGIMSAFSKKAAFRCGPA